VKKGGKDKKLHIELIVVVNIMFGAIGITVSIYNAH